MFLRIFFNCWKSANNRCSILFMAIITLCIMGYEWHWQNPPLRTRQKITLTLSGPIGPLKETIKVNSNNLLSNFNMTSSSSIEDMEFLLNVRKLNVFVVREMNKITKSSNSIIYNSDCIKWWANPLTTESIEEIFHNKEYSDKNITYVVHPGHFRFNVQVRQRKPPIEPPLSELEIISPFNAIPPLSKQLCLGKEASEKLKSVCQCENSYEELATDLEGDTLKERIEWNTSDPELITWRLHKSFSVEDYLNFTNYDTFTHSPGKKNKTERAKYCQPSTKMLIMISSAPKHFLHRKVIRNTYGIPENLHDKGVRLVFLMGKLEESDYKEDLQKEMSVHDDIIEGSFVDSYHNLTLSHLSMYKWIYLTCTQENLEMPSHVLKADDDFFINIDLALSLVEVNPNAEYIGCLYCGTKPIRDLSYMTKYYTPRYMYTPDTYVGYLSGVTYIFKTEVIPKVLHVSLDTPIIHMDDVYMTGLIPRQLKIQPRNSPLITYARIEPDSCLIKKSISSCVLNPEDMLLQWKKFLEPEPLNCTLDYIDYHLEELDQGTKKACYFA